MRWLVASTSFGLCLLGAPNASAEAPTTAAGTFAVACGEPHPALDRVAEKLALRKSRGEPPLDLPDLALAVLAEHVAYVWPRAWVASGPSAEALAAGFGAHQKTLPPPTRPVCGRATLDLGNGKVVGAVVILDAKGELAPIKERARVGEFLGIEATLDGEARDARVMVKGPFGAPRTVPGHFDPASRKVRATFAPDAPGAFVVQIVADTERGPRPVLETRVFANVPPTYARDPRELASPIVAGQADDALFSLVKKLRQDEGLPALARDPKLDAVAKAHVETMIAKQSLAHDTGDGDPRARAEEAGIRARIIAENLATGREVLGLHRALTESPSHHANLRSAALDRIGLAVVADAKGALWGCEIFAGGTP
jgi:uncharacterized protein YkwD